MLTDNRPDPARAHAAAAWAMITAGVAAGAVLGLWSFAGPVPAPPGFETYDALPRRMMRLAHIAAIALPALNLLYLSWIRRTAWGPAARRRWRRILLAGTVALPTLLAAAAFWPPAKYALPIPVTAVGAALAALATGLAGPWRAFGALGPLATPRSASLASPRLGGPSRPGRLSGLHRPSGPKNSEGRQPCTSD